MSLDSETIKRAVHAVLDERDGLDRERHRHDHDWVYEQRQALMQRTQRRGDLREKIKATVIGGAALTLVTVAATGVYNVGRFVIDLYQKSQSGH